MSAEAQAWGIFVGLPVAAIILLWLLGGGADPAPARPTPAPARMPPMQAEAVAEAQWHAVDGDTIKSPAGVSYRLMGFDTPEIAQAKHAGERAMGIEAQRKLQAIIDSGDVRLELAGRKDKYGRELGTLFAGDRPVSEIMIGEGLARPNNGERRKPW